ncbi:MAG: hypothetical protein WCJ09_09665 [Planctomycetota bacterium]
MSVEAFSGLLGRCDVSPTGKRWFPVWVGRYASHLSKSPTARLAVDRETVIGFLRSLRDAGVPAWQRLQAVQSIECYRDVVHCVASRVAPVAASATGVTKSQEVLKVYNG